LQEITTGTEVRPNFIHVAPSKLDLSLAHLRSRPKSSIEAMVRSLEKRGQIHPVTVAADGERLILVDGFKRHQGAALIGMDKLCAVALPHYGPAIKALVYLLNRAAGFSLVEECLLIRELVEKDGLKQVDVAVMMDRHKSWVSRRLETVRRLNPQIIEDIRVGLLPPGSARSLARLPECNQVDLGAAIQRDRLKGEEIHRLVGLWCRAQSPDQRRFIVESSRKALELAGSQGRGESSPVPSHLHGFFKTIGSLDRIARVLKHRCSSGLGAMTLESEAFLTQALDAAENQCREAISSAYSALNRKEAQTP